MRTTAIAALACALAWMAAPAAQAQTADAGRSMTVVKTPWCGCCGAWAERMREAGFAVTVEEADDLAPVRQAAGVPDGVAGCHTARVGGYVIEGHVPAVAIEKLLAERPAVTGIAAPGMPAGSPGMGDDPDARYDVLSFDARGPLAVYHEAGR